ncbi:MAG: hypothetical protein AB3N14_12615 [Flavobacteriaceae bacterium]
MLRESTPDPVGKVLSASQFTIDRLVVDLNWWRRHQGDDCKRIFHPKKEKWNPSIADIADTNSQGNLS